MRRSLSSVGPGNCRRTVVSKLSSTYPNRSARRGAGDLPTALKRYFTNRAEVIGLDLNELFRVGRRSLAIGLSVLSLCIIVSQTVSALAPPPFNRVIEESLLIFGWVANWRPIEIFLYDWWPINRRRNLYRRIAAARSSYVRISRLWLLIQMKKHWPIVRAAENLIDSGRKRTLCP
jgi:hypothetical protein